MHLGSAALERSQVQIEDALVENAVNNPVLSAVIVGRPVAVDWRRIIDGSHNAREIFLVGPFAGDIHVEVGKGFFELGKYFLPYVDAANLFNLFVKIVTLLCYFKVPILCCGSC